MASIKRKAASGSGTPSAKPLPSKKIRLDDMQSWVSKLDVTLDKSITEHATLGKIFGEKLLRSIQKHKLFWPKLIGSIVSGVHFRPETAICWISFHLINLINEEKLELSSAAELLSYLHPFMQIKSLFESFAAREQVPSVENIGYYRLSYEPATADKCASFSITSRNSTSNILIAQITEDSVPEVTHNTCLIIAFLITLCESDQKVLDLITLEDQEVLKFLTAAIMDIKKTVVNSPQPPDDESHSQNYLLQNSAVQIQTANFALSAFMQCFDEIPDNVSFSDLLSSDLKSHLSYLAAHETFKELFEGKVKSWPADKKQYATLTFQMLVARTIAKMYNLFPPSSFVTCTDGMNPLHFGNWVYGNYAIGHQTYQFKLTKPFTNVSQFYAELRPLTSGPIKFGFAPPIERESESLQDLTEIPGAICYDYYENGLWISNKEYIPKKDDDLPDSQNSISQQVADPATFFHGRNHVVIGVLLNINATDELEAVQFFVNGQEINSQMDVGDIQKPSAKRLWEDPSEFLLSVAPAAYQQAILVLDRQHWEYNRDNEEVESFEEIMQERNQVEDDAEDTAKDTAEDTAKETAEDTAEDTADNGNQSDLPACTEKNCDSYDESDFAEEEDIDNENYDPLGMRDTDFLSDYETDDHALSENY